MKLNRWLIVVTLVAFAMPVWAEPSNRTQQADPSNQTSMSSSLDTSSLGWQGWGVRFGMTQDADQFVGGAHFNLGEVAHRLRFQPDIELGSGDDVTSLYGTVPLYYRFGNGATMTPYAGGGVALGYVDVDRPEGFSGDETSFEVGARATGGFEWLRSDGNVFFVELSLGFGDVHDARIVGAWTF